MQLASTWQLENSLSISMLFTILGTHPNKSTSYLAGLLLRAVTHSVTILRKGEDPNPETHGTQAGFEKQKSSFDN